MTSLYSIWRLLCSSSFVLPPPTQIVAETLDIEVRHTNYYILPVLPVNGFIVPVLHAALTRRHERPEIDQTAAVPQDTAQKCGEVGGCAPLRSFRMGCQCVYVQNSKQFHSLLFILQWARAWSWA
jgi:hypothetical protein